jgi:integrase
MALRTAIEATKAKPKAKPYRLSFGDGLLLEVKPSGAKVWLCRYMLAGKRRDMGLGGFPAVGLADARRKAAEARRSAGEGHDPIATREAARAALDAEREAAEAKGALTFRAVAERLLAVQAPAWTSDKTRASWRLTLDKWAFPAIGDVPIADVGREHVIQAREPVWTAKPATARKLQRRISATLDYAAANGWRAADNPAAGRVLRLTKALPPVNANGRRWPSLPWQRVPAFLAALSAQAGFSPLALRWAVLTAVRSNEVREARWDELDFEAGLWTIPGRRMKGGRAKELPPHRVPLTLPMLDLLALAMEARTGTRPDLRELPKRAALLGDALLFPAAKGGPLSDAALGACIRRLNEATPEGQPPLWRDADGRPATAHGFRRSFRTWVDDERPEDAAAAEKALAHDEPNKVSAAYRGSDLLGRRRELMAAWGTFCTAPTVKAGRARRGALAVAG